MKIGLLTQSKELNTLVSELRKKGYSANLVDADDSLDSYGVIVVDLNYPLDHAYVILEKLKEGYEYSDKIVLSVISQKSQLMKLRSQALGCDGYISPSIPTEEFIRKIQFHKDPKNQSHCLSFDSIPIQAKFSGKLTHISESGCLILSKVSPNFLNQKLNIESQFLEEIQSDQKINFKLKKSFPSTNRSFISQINFVGISEAQRQKIRVIESRWRDQ